MLLVRTIMAYQDIPGSIMLRTLGLATPCSVWHYVQTQELELVLLLTHS